MRTRIKVRVTVSPDLLRVPVEPQIAASVQKYLPLLEAVFTEEKINLIQTVLPHKPLPWIREKLPLARNIRGPEAFLVG
jgi:hypothetical protein